MEEVTLQRITCDNPDCDTLEFVHEFPVGWYDGGVIYHHAGGGDGDSWHACKPACIKKAVLAVTQGSN